MYSPFPAVSVPLLVSFQFEDSEDDFERFDTDDELSYRRDSVYSCVTLPYFHSFLFIKGNYSAPFCLKWQPSFFSASCKNLFWFEVSLQL